MITIQTQIEVSTAALGDVAITAAEGGIGHWAVIDEYRPSRWDGIEVDEDDFVFYTIEYENPENDSPPRLTTAITPRVLAEGLGYVLRQRHIEDVSEVDAVEADEIVQYGVFGELVFS